MSPPVKTPLAVSPWAATRCFRGARRRLRPTSCRRPGRRPRCSSPSRRANRLVVTHGNGPQVGLLSLKEDAFGAEDPYPLDVLDAETEGQIGYVIELALDNAIDHQDTVAVLTRVLVDGE